jgi:pimeloyl-ACP methyl ester carboxylesterase
MGVAMSFGPQDRLLTANRLTHHVLTWGDEGPVVILLHGFLEHAHAWDWVAPRLAAVGYHVFALDWRGHGDSEWLGPGGYYHFADYVADLAFVVRQVGGRAALVGHSMGGNAALTYAGTEPERVTALVTIEGIGPPGMSPKTAPDSFAAWVRDLERIDHRQGRAITLEEATQRLRERFPAFSESVARHMAEYGTRENGGKRFWKFDPLHQTHSPQPYYVDQAQAFWRSVSCPILYVDGTASTLALSPADVAERLAILGASRASIEGAGHHPHLERPGPLAELIIDFFTTNRVA